MLVDVKVPVLAESVPDATLLDWRKEPGELVSRDEILIELETDKVVLEVPAPEAGMLVELVKQSGDIAVELNGIDLTEKSAMGTLWKSFNEMTEVELVVERDGQRHQVYIQF